MSKFMTCLLAALGVFYGHGTAPAQAEMTGLQKIQASKTDFRVCADPDELPFSSRAGEGFENKIAALLAHAAGRPLVYDWWPARRGFIGQTLNHWNCDVVMGVPAGYELTATTNPYYCSHYVMAYRDDEHPPSSFLDSAASRRLRIGVVERTPPLDMVIRHRINPVVYFTDYGYRHNSPGLIIRDLADRKIDVALVWGPIGGYFARRSTVAIDIAPLTAGGERDIRLAFPISVGVRHGDKDRIAWLDRLLMQNAQAIDAILTSYGVPLVHDRQDCSVARKEAAEGSYPSVRLVAQSVQSTQSKSDATQQHGGRPPLATASSKGGATQTVPCNPNETIDQVKSKLPAPSGQQGVSGSTQRPYVVQGNKLGAKAYEGWIRFAAFCERCHGPGGVGSAQAPDLTVAVKGLTQPQFEHIVRCGLTGNIGIGVMPPWGDNPNIAPYVDDLWSYLQARADNAIGPGRPEKLAGSKQ